MVESSNGEESSNSNKQLLESFRAMMNESMATMRAELRSELDRSINDQLRRNPQPSDAEQYYSHSSRSHHSRRRRPREDQPLRINQTNPRDPLAGFKIEIPSFHGTNDPEEYLEWEKKVEIVFDCREFTQDHKVRIAPTAFKDYALSWWDQLVTSRRRVGDLPVETWNQMKIIMRKRFIPSHYHRELHLRLRNLSQGSRSVEEYYKELETLLLRANIQEDNEAAMARFMGGLNKDIIERLEVHHYIEMEELLHKAVMFEKQLKRKNPKLSYASPRFNQTREDKLNKEYQPFPKPKIEEQRLKGIDKGSSTKTREIQCFKCKGFGHYSNACSNKRTIVIRANGELESEEEHSEAESKEEQIAMPTVGQLLVTRRALNLHTNFEKNEQRENLFHTRCLVKEKVCSLVIDGG